MKIVGFIWLEEIAEKLEVKHQVFPDEVEQVFSNQPSVKRMNRAMQGKNSAVLDGLPDNFTTLDEFWGFWDTHSSADYEDAMEAVEIELDTSSSTVYVPVAKDLVSKVRAQARRQGVSSETLVNLWLQERLSTSA